jgi:hypothetical protein
MPATGSTKKTPSTPTGSSASPIRVSDRRVISGW